MPLLRITTRYDRLADAELILKASGICKQLSAHPDVFTAPDPSPATLRAAIVALTEAKAKASDGSRIAIAEKNVRRTELIELLYLVGYYVLYIAKGKPEVVHLAGLSLMKEATATVLEVPSTPTLKAGQQRGWIEVSVNVIEAARSYLHQYSTDPTLDDRSWITQSGTTAACILKGLTPGQLYYVRVGVVGTKGKVLFSVVQSRMAS